VQRGSDCIFHKERAVGLTRKNGSPRGEPYQESSAFGHSRNWGFAVA
jgi:hypothetical protein